MAFDIIFEPDAANLANLESLSHDGNLLFERRACELYELAVGFLEFAKGLIDDGMSFCEILLLLSDSEVISKNKNTTDKTKMHVKNIDESDRALFAALIKRVCAEKGIVISENMFLPSQELPDTFTYVKNAFADEAYDIFSQEFSDPRVVYSNIFKEALASVADGTVSYCLLPIEERGVRLSTVSELLFKGDFKIVSVTPILGFDGLADMKYALVSRSFSPLEYSDDDDRYFELRLPENSDISLKELLIAAEAYGISLYKVNTMRFDTEDGERNYYSLIFYTSGADFIDMLIYLNLFAGEFIPVGIYKNIE